MRQVLFDESTILVPGQFKLVYFTSGARDVYGVSKPFQVRLVAKRSRPCLERDRDSQNLCIFHFQF